MKQDRLSIHISDCADITVEERIDGIKKIKNISLDDPACLHKKQS